MCVENLFSKSVMPIENSSQGGLWLDSCIPLYFLKQLPVTEVIYNRQVVPEGYPPPILIALSQITR